MHNADQANSTQRILIVDDEYTVAVTLQEGLAKLTNCEIVTTTSVQKAISYLMQQTFNLLITDFQMPKTNGMALAETARTLQPHLSVVMITGFSEQLHPEDFARMGIQAVLAKPVKLAEIRRVASAALTLANDSKRPFLPGTC